LDTALVVRLAPETVSTWTDWTSTMRAKICWMTAFWACLPPVDGAHSGEGADRHDPDQRRDHDAHDEQDLGSGIHEATVCQSGAQAVKPGMSRCA